MVKLFMAAAEEAIKEAGVRGDWTREARYGIIQDNNGRSVI
jgi:hypothetical protein